MSLADLIAEVEKLTAPSREVDGHLFGWLHNTEPCGTFMMCFGDEDKFQFRHPTNERGAWYVPASDVPEYTGCCGAAMRLAVEKLDDGAIDIEVAYRSVGGIAHGRAEICGPIDDSAAVAATPAIALLLAFLRAIEARAGCGKPQSTPLFPHPFP